MFNSSTCGLGLYSEGAIPSTLTNFFMSTILSLPDMMLAAKKTGKSVFIMDEDTGHWRKVLKICQKGIRLSAWTNFKRPKKYLFDFNDDRLGKVKLC